MARTMNSCSPAFRSRSNIMSRPAACARRHYKLNVVDLPGVKQIRVTYHYPAWSGMKDSVEDPGGDLRAVEGTTADVQIGSDRPLPNGVILLDDDTRIPLHDGVARVPIQKDGMYHIASVERGVEHGIGQNEDVRLTDDYFIEARKDNPPTVRIRRPGRDAKANPSRRSHGGGRGRGRFRLAAM